LKTILCFLVAGLLAGHAEEPAVTSPTAVGAVTWLEAPAFVPAADCDGEGICSSPNAACRALRNDYCNSSMSNWPNPGCKEPDMAGRTHKSDPNGDCCFCLYDN
jgi:hypothetical protein